MDYAFKIEPKEGRPESNSKAVRTSSSGTKALRLSSSAGSDGETVFTVNLK